MLLLIPACPAAVCLPSDCVFRILCLQVDFGQQVLVVGNVPELGGWELGRAPQMTWSEGDNWSVAVEVPAGSQFEFKFALQSPNL